MPGAGPAGAVGVEENVDVREGFVVVDDVGEVGHCFAGFVDRGAVAGWGSGVGGQVDDVDYALPGGELGVDPAGVFAEEGAHYDCFGEIFACGWVGFGRAYGFMFLTI